MSTNCRPPGTPSPGARQFDPYVRAGLERNPFALDAPGALPSAIFADLGYSLSARLPKPRAGILFELIGAHGAGKSTHLMQWRRLYPGPYRHVRLHWRRFVSLPVDDICYWDEAYRVPRPLLAHALRRVASTRASVVVAGHVSIAEFAAAYPIEVRQFRFPPLTAARMMHFVAQRLGAATCPGQTCAVSMPERDAARIAAACGSSWRDASDLLHAWLADAVRQHANINASAVADTTARVRKPGCDCVD